MSIEWDMQLLEDMQTLLWRSEGAAAYLLLEITLWSTGCGSLQDMVLNEDIKMNQLYAKHVT